ncbi:hypothetical protein DIPPA_35004 [Diplonema papillatum]|nr:hypothetical protein DIPPA_35004 [Diplonema papillatum]
METQGYTDVMRWLAAYQSGAAEAPALATLEELLRERRGSVNIRSCGGATAMMLAARDWRGKWSAGDQEAIVRAVVAAGGCLYTADDEGNTALSCLQAAPQRHRDFILRVISDYRDGADRLLRSVAPLSGSRMLRSGPCAAAAGGGREFPEIGDGLAAAKVGDVGMQRVMRASKACEHVVYYLSGLELRAWDWKRDVEYIVHDPTDAFPWAEALYKEKERVSGEREVAEYVKAPNVRELARKEAKLSAAIERYEADIPKIATFVNFTGPTKLSRYEWIYCDVGILLESSVGEDGLTPTSDSKVPVLDDEERYSVACNSPRSLGDSIRIAPLPRVKSSYNVCKAVDTTPLSYATPDRACNTSALIDPILRLVCTADSALEDHEDAYGNPCRSRFLRLSVVELPMAKKSAVGKGGCKFTVAPLHDPELLRAAPRWSRRGAVPDDELVAVLKVGARYILFVTRRTVVAFRGGVFTDLTGQLAVEGAVASAASLDTQPYRVFRHNTERPLFAIVSHCVELCSLEERPGGALVAKRVFLLPRDRHAEQAYDVAFHPSSDLLVILRGGRSQELCCFDYVAGEMASLCKLPRPSSLVFSGGAAAGAAVPHLRALFSRSGQYLLRHNLSVNLVSIYPWADVLATAAEAAYRNVAFCPLPGLTPPPPAGCPFSPEGGGGGELQQASAAVGGTGLVTADAQNLLSRRLWPAAKRAAFAAALAGLLAELARLARRHQGLPAARVADAAQEVCAAAADGGNPHGHAHAGGGVGPGWRPAAPPPAYFFADDGVRVLFAASFHSPLHALAFCADALLLARAAAANSGSCGAPRPLSLAAGGVSAASLSSAAARSTTAAAAAAANSSGSATQPAALRRVSLAQGSFSAADEYGDAGGSEGSGGTPACLLATVTFASLPASPVTPRSAGFRSEVSFSGGVNQTTETAQRQQQQQQKEEEEDGAGLVSPRSATFHDGGLSPGETGGRGNQASKPGLRQQQQQQQQQKDPRQRHGVQRQKRASIQQQQQEQPEGASPTAGLCSPSAAAAAAAGVEGAADWFPKLRLALQFSRPDGTRPTPCIADSACVLREAPPFTVALSVGELQALAPFVKEPFFPKLDIRCLAPGKPRDTDNNNNPRQPNRAPRDRLFVGVPIPPAPEPGPTIAPHRIRLV